MSLTSTLAMNQETNILNFVTAITSSGQLIFVQSKEYMDALQVLLSSTIKVNSNGEVITSAVDDFTKQHVIIETIEGDIKIYQRELSLPRVLNYVTGVNNEGKLSFSGSYEYISALLNLLKYVSEIKENGEILIHSFEAFSNLYKVMQSEVGIESIYLRDMKDTCPRC